MKKVFEGNVIRVTNDIDFKEVLKQYKIDEKFFAKNIRDKEDFIRECINIKGMCWYKTYEIQLNVENNEIYWIGLTDENYNYGEVQLYKNENLTRSILCDVMTFAEASKKWGLGESTLRSAIKTDRFIENIDYKKSGKVWLITTKAMEKVYGQPLEDV